MKGGDKPMEPRCALDRVQVDQINVEEVKTDGWREHEIFVMPISDPRLGWIERQVIQQAGDRIYGRRKNGH